MNDEVSRQDIEALRKDLEEKHKENRKSIHEIKNEQQKVALDLAIFDSKIKPLVDNGQPGLITKMSRKLDELLNEITEVRIEQSSVAGSKKSADWWQDALRALLIGIVVALAAHFWK